MGHYTALGVDAIVKPQYREAVKTWLTTPPGPHDKSRYHQLYDLLFVLLHKDGACDFAEPQILQDLKRYMTDARADFIPFGKLIVTGHCSGWCDQRSFWLPSGRLTFTCGLKNYSQTIESWLRLVGAHLCESFRCVQTENESDGPRCGCNYELHDGQVRLVSTWWESERDFYGQGLDSDPPQAEFPDLVFQGCLEEEPTKE